MRYSLSLAAAALGALAACNSGGQRATGAAVDDTGRPVDLRLAPQRLVSLAPGLTELLFAIGAGDRVVGRTRWGDYPPEASEIPSVGEGLAPNVEVIIGRRPDLVVFYASPANSPAIRQLEKLGIATVSLRTDRLADLTRAARLLGRIVGDSGTADSLASALELEIAALESTRPSRVVPKVLILAWDNPPITIGSESFLSEIVELAGGRNIFDDIDKPSATVSIETIVERDPDIVLVVSDSGIPRWSQRPEWQTVRAVREGRFIVAPGTEFGRPTFRAPAAIRRLRQEFAKWAR